jgi:hypothetical protein
LIPPIPPPLLTLDTVLDELEAAHHIRYYRFIKVRGLMGGYIFKTFIDRKDGDTREYRGFGETRIAAVRQVIDDIHNNRPSPNRKERGGPTPGKL